MTRVLILLLLFLMTGCGVGEPNTESKSIGEQQTVTPGEESKPTATKLVPTITHETVAGTGEMEGWTVYEPMVMVEREKAGELISGNKSIEGAIIQFFASLMRGDKDFETILSPTMQASVRERFTTEMPVAMEGLNQISIQSHLSAEEAANHPLAGRTATVAQELFGDFDVMVFCEGNTKAEDILMSLVQHEDNWYIAGILARQFEALLPPKPPID